MSGNGDVAHVLTIAVRARDEHGFLVATEEDLPGTTLPIRGEGRLEIDHEALFKPCAKWVRRLTVADRTGEYAAR